MKFEAQEFKPQSERETQEKVAAQNAENQEVMRAALKVVQGFIEEIDPDLSVEFVPGMDIDGLPDLGVFYRKGQKYHGLICKLAKPNLTNEGGTYRPGGARGDIESGKFAHSAKEEIEAALRKQGIEPKRNNQTKPSNAVEFPGK